MTTKLTPPVFYSTMINNDVFQPQHFDHRRTYASNIREITRADGSIVKEFVFENPHAMRSMTSSDDEQKSSKEKFAEIKAKFEQNTSSSPKTPSTYQPSISRTNSFSKTADVQYEMIDENGNHLPIDGIENIIKMSGVATREFQQDDGTIVREYVIDDPKIVSQVQQKSCPPLPPPPPPRLARQASSLTPLDLQTVENVEKHRPYQFVTSTGRQIQCVITEIDDEPTQLDQTNPFEEFPPLVTEPIIDWSILRQQDPDGQIDPEFIRQFINQRHQAELQSISTNFYSENVRK